MNGYLVRGATVEVMDSRLKLLEDWEFRSWLGEREGWFTPAEVAGGAFVLLSLPFAALASSVSGVLAGGVVGVGLLVTLGLTAWGRVKRRRFLKGLSADRLYELQVQAAVFKNCDRLPAALVNSEDPVVAGAVVKAIMGRAKVKAEVNELVLLKARAGFRGTVGELRTVAEEEYLRSLNAVGVVPDEDLRAVQNTLLSSVEVLLNELPSGLSVGLRERFDVLRESAVRDLGLLEKFKVLNVPVEQLGRYRERVVEANESLRLVVDELDALVVSTRPVVGSLVEDIGALKDASVGLHPVKINS